jgi:hypothetical protein
MADRPNRGFSTDDGATAAVADAIEVPILPGTEAERAQAETVELARFGVELRPARDAVERDKRQALVGGLIAMGYTTKEISDITSLSVRQVEITRRQLRDRKAIAAGIEEAIERIDGEAIPLAVDSLISHLRKEDKEMTIEALKGRGLFKTHVNQKNTGDPVGGNRAFNINIMMAPGQAAPQMAGNVVSLGVGAPRTDDTPQPLLPEGE